MQGNTDLPRRGLRLDDAVIAVSQLALILFGWRGSINIWGSWSIRIELQGKQRLRLCGGVLKQQWRSEMMIICLDKLLDSNLKSEPACLPSMISSEISESSDWQLVETSCPSEN